MVKVKNTNTRTKPIKLRNRWAKQYRHKTYRNASRKSTSLGGKKQQNGDISVVVKDQQDVVGKIIL